jgi:hypothetical protein
MAGGAKCTPTGKTQYDSRDDARIALAKLAARRGGGKSERSAYRCHFCGQWHLTSMGDSPKRKTRLTPNQRWRWDGSAHGGDDDE